MIKYLRKVILDEGDTNKAANLVTWIDYIIGDKTETLQGFARVPWEQCLVAIKDSVSRACKEKKLGLVSFD